MHGEPWTRPIVRGALAAFALALGLALWALTRALNGNASADTTASTFNAPTSFEHVGGRVTPDIARAVENDLFQEDRTAPTSPYRLTTDEGVVGAPVEAEVAQKPVVIGTAVVGVDHSFATCQLGASPPVIVRVGDKLGPYTVKVIERGHVTFTDAAGSPLDIPALKSGAQ